MPSIWLRSFQNMKQRGAPGRAERFLVEINAMRALYPYSSRSITLDSSTNIYLAHQQDNLVGFCEVLLKNTDISNPRPVFLSLTELHVAPSMQGSGIGTQIMNHLLKMKVPVELAIIEKDERAQLLLRRFNYLVKSQVDGIRTIVISGSRQAS